MAKKTPRTRAAGSPAAKKARPPASHSYCCLRPERVRTFAPEVTPGRLELIVRSASKWVNGTVLRYYFFDKPTDGEQVVYTDGTSEWVPWTTTAAEKEVVRQAFAVWKEVGVGLEFKEVATREEAEVRIGFMRGDGAWSYLGKGVRDHGPNERTMNFGWDLTRHATEIDTAVHEIGHTLGFPHEHQNPNAGILWDEEAVYTSLAAPPNKWSRDKTFWNIIRKIEADSVQGSSWDPNSIMHYPFESGLIKQPAEYRTGLNPAGGLSPRDKTWVKTFYPPLAETDYTPLVPMVSAALPLQPAEQKNFRIAPTATRDYEIRTFGTSDTVVVLFVEEGGELQFLAGDDDSGEDRNAYLKVKLFKERKYVLRVRLYYAEAGETAVMLW